MFYVLLSSSPRLRLSTVNFVIRFFCLQLQSWLSEWIWKILFLRILLISLRKTSKAYQIFIGSFFDYSVLMSKNTFSSYITDLSENLFLCILWESSVVPDGGVLHDKITSPVLEVFFRKNCCNISYLSLFILGDTILTIIHGCKLIGNEIKRKRESKRRDGKPLAFSRNQKVVGDGSLCTLPCQRKIDYSCSPTRYFWVKRLNRTRKDIHFDTTGVIGRHVLDIHQVRGFSMSELTLEM